MANEWSHGKRRPTARDAHGDLPALARPSVESAPTHDPVTGRFVPGNRAYRRRQLKERAHGISTLNPASVPSWMRPFVAEGVKVAAEFAQRFPDDAALLPLLGGAVDAIVVFKALLSQGIGSEGVPGDPDALKEARAWLREHRAAIATISALISETPRAAESPEAMKRRLLGGAE